jgi:hypothetical protein
VTTKYLDILEAAKGVKYANGIRPISKQDIDSNFSSIIQDYNLIRGRLIRLGNRLLFDTNEKDRQGMNRDFEGRKSNEIRKRVFEMKAKNQKNGKDTLLNKIQMITIYNNMIRAVYLEIGSKKPPLEKDFSTIRQTFLELFYIETKRTKTGYIYKFGSEITAKNVLQI